MEIGGINLEYYIDYINRRVHILDRERIGNKLVNTISPQWMEEFIQHENLLIGLMDFDWLCYATNGIILLYKDYNIQIVSSDTSLIYRPYVEYMKNKGKKA